MPDHLEQTENTAANAALQSPVRKTRETFHADRESLGTSNDDTISRVINVVDPNNPTSEGLTNLEAPEENVKTTEEFTEMSEKLTLLLRHGIHGNLKTLYRALQSQLRNCKRPHNLLLRLTGFYQNDHDPSKTEFQFCINSRHHGPDYEWMPCTGDFAGHMPIPAAETTLCKHIKQAEQDRKSVHISFNLQFRERTTLRSHKLHQSLTQDSSAHPMTLGYGKLTRTTRVKSLTELISLARLGERGQTTRINTKNRYRLCFNLALSAFFLTSEPWKQVRWCQGEHFDANIFFSLDQENIRNQTEAYLFCPIDPHLPHPEADPDIKCDLKLLELGKILVEVRFWKKLEFFSEARGVLSRDEIRKRLHIHINEHPDMNPFETLFVGAVEACLEFDGNMAADEILEHILTNIIEPLAKCAETSSIAAEDPQEHVMHVAEDPQEPLKKLPHSGERSFYSEKAKGFMGRMYHFTSEYVTPLSERRMALPEDRNEKIRIAIIDSGVSTRDKEIDKYISGKRIVGQRNFFRPGVENCEDFHGHGTTVAKIVLQVAPQAEVFVAKVTNSQSISDKELDNVREAINWAVQVWRVDIINLSLTMTVKDLGIDTALTHALKPSSKTDTAKIIIAAAHKNVGRHEAPSWPGSRFGIIAIHSTDGDGQPQGTNASVGRDDYFATLGRDIPIKKNFGTIRSRDVYATGVSYATPIAAGIAANVLEIVRHQASPTVDVKRYFYNGRYMKTVFEHISQRDNRCLFIQPWTFWYNIIYEDARYNGVDLYFGDEGNAIKVLESLAD